MGFYIFPLLAFIPVSTRGVRRSATWEHYEDSRFRCCWDRLSSRSPGLMQSRTTLPAWHLLRKSDRWLTPGFGPVVRSGASHLAHPRVKPRAEGSSTYPTLLRKPIGEPALTGTFSAILLRAREPKLANRENEIIAQTFPSIATEILNSDKFRFR